MNLLERIRQALGSESDERPSPWSRPETAPDSEELANLEVVGDPRGGVQAPGYRHADPRDLVVGERVTMMGPAGAPSRTTAPRARDASEEEQPERRRSATGR